MFRLYPTAVWLRPQSLLALTRWFCNEPLPPPSLPLPRSQNKNKSPAGLVGESPLRGKGYISRWSNKKMFWFILKERRIFLNQHHTPSIGATRYRLVRQLSVRNEYLMFLKLKKYVSKLNKYVLHSREVGFDGRKVLKKVLKKALKKVLKWKSAQNSTKKSA